MEALNLSPEPYRRWLREIAFDNSEDKGRRAPVIMPSHTTSCASGRGCVGGALCLHMAFQTPKLGNVSPSGHFGRSSGVDGGLHLGGGECLTSSQCHGRSRQRAALQSGQALTLEGVVNTPGRTRTETHAWQSER